jgi:hypothetical protein
LLVAGREEPIAQGLLSGCRNSLAPKQP